MKQVVITDIAIKDIEQAKTWYNKQQPQLGNTFVDYIFESIEQIHKHPLSFPNKHAFTREMAVKKFPYLIIFSIEEDILFILRVFPCRTNPKKKYKH
ncbi:MAG: type II toxin-antitoxin system RelE/ParE family toxin [Bacteroidota bacterium]